MATPIVAGLRRTVLALLGLAMLAVALTAIPLLPATAAHAAPTADDLQQQISQKAKDLDLVIEQYNQLNVTLGRTQARAAALATSMQPLVDRVNAASTAVNALAVNAYEGSTLSGLSALLDAGSPDVMVDKLSTLNQLSRRQTDGVAALRAASDALRGQKAQLDGLIAAQTSQQAVLAARKTSIQTQVASLKKQQSQLPGQTTSSDGSHVPPPTVSGQAAKVVAYAYAQLGKPYVFGAAGPSTFDCSGLTMMAWAQVGVHLDHASYTQMNEQTTPIPRSALQPGDLVFFYGGEHVGIYIGSNSVIHAPQPGDVVKISTIDWMGGYTASGRPG